MAKTCVSSRQKPRKEIGNRSKGAQPGENGKTDLIQLRAYEIYQERIRKSIPGDMLSDWKKAEQEVSLMKTGLN